MADLNTTAGPVAASRVETDSLGSIAVPGHVLWGAQTARSLQFFAIGEQRMPLELVHAMAWVKWAAAVEHLALGLLPPGRAQAIAAAAERVAQGEWDQEFPLSVWQTGSGTQSHMNVNEVVARLASRALAAAGEGPVSAHDEVNRGQSSNDVVPTAMHLAALCQARDAVLPALEALQQALQEKALAWQDVIKIGRTHLQDATPLSLGQEFGGYAAQLGLCRQAIGHALVPLRALAIGGTAVGTGLNTHPAFGAGVAARLARRLGLPGLHPAADLFAALAGHEALVGYHASLRQLAIALTKIANDVRLMGSGPRAGLGELHLPENEPGSSLMPGKVNPTQVEAMCMVCAQVMGHDLAIGLAASQGQLELNTCRPLIALNTLDSGRLLADAMESFTRHCVRGLQPDLQRLQQGLAQSLMLVTALTPHIGYERAAAIVQQARRDNQSLREAALALGSVSAADFDRWVDPRRMLGPAVG